ncbi:ExeA family protein [Allochromatium vinosum]|uniref:Peptidoglycan-binding domain 1 protein n=1 Tax=Allochromatium vinosum (strain ATCC 17899 / DSM 180 / NBRC 103801 / NCIMB 10441 / D) TaxID=572477 RepID=D3RSY6_ALLVD|nr:ExeA family protein [Allochromatium vinosum]ADC62295.1 Peptidoglycan-binding domain 1 protein [Allochromatium vinosum DSM 180]
MYPKYFGLKEPSFSIAPDPHYLFLSDQHREALAHLLYGANESGGFVLLTGEVGTGKTTVCRAFLEQLPEGVDVALVLNPVQSPNELLTNICEEFRIELPHGRRSNKVLIDALNGFLLHAYANGRRPLLIIDEAQNLPRQALEQIRLLTNLETTKHKLLQIFLIGQPELRRLLETQSLRQLDQRITARFHLTPLDLEETGDYIRHRLAVAGVDRPLFTARAIRRIHEYSGGIPRVINILCDRALLGACVTRGSQVDPDIVATAAREVRGEALEAMPPRSPGRLVLIAVASFLVATLVGLLAQTLLTPERRALLAGWWSGETAFMSLVGAVVPSATSVAEPVRIEASPEPGTRLTDAPVSESPVVAAPEVPGVADSATAPETPAVPEQSADEAPVSITSLALSESEAMRVLLRRWGLDLKTIGAGDPCAHIRPFGLGCESEQGRLSHVRFFNLPALLRLADRDGTARYLVLSELDVTEATLDRPDGRTRVPVSELESVWSGDYRLVWQLPPGGSTLIRPGAVGEEVRWLRDLVSRVPGLASLPGPADRYDVTLESALRAFQASKGLTADGVAGPRTFIALYQAIGLDGIPRLDETLATTASMEVLP